MKKLIPKIIKFTPIFLVLIVYLLIPLGARAQSVQCAAVEEGGTCSSGEYTIRYTGVDEFGNRKFNVRKVALGADERYIDSPFLTDYLAAMYKYAVIATTILVTVVIIFAGVLYITSAGNTEQTGRAKKMIARAITGLVLAVGSYTILWTINPQLVEFGGLKILRIEKKSIDEALFEEGFSNTKAGGTSADGGASDIKSVSIRTEHMTHYIEVIPEIADSLKAAAKELYDSTATMSGGPWKIRGGGYRKVGQRGDKAAGRKDTQAYKWEVKCEGKNQCDTATCNPFVGGGMKDGKHYAPPNAETDPKLCSHTQAKAIDITCSSAGLNVAAQGKIYAPCQRKLEEIMIKNGWCRLPHEKWHFEKNDFKITNNCSTNKDTVVGIQVFGSDKEDYTRCYGFFDINNNSCTSAYFY